MKMFILHIVCKFTYNVFLKVSWQMVWLAFLKRGVSSSNGCFWPELHTLKKSQLFTEFPFSYISNLKFFDPRKYFFFFI